MERATLARSGEGPGFPTAKASNLLRPGSLRSVVSFRKSVTLFELLQESMRRRLHAVFCRGSIAFIRFSET